MATLAYALSPVNSLPILGLHIIGFGNLIPIVAVHEPPADFLIHAFAKRCADGYWQLPLTMR